MNLETFFLIVIFSGIISVMLMSARGGQTEDLYNLQTNCRHDWSIRYDGEMTCLKCDGISGKL